MNSFAPVTMLASNIFALSVYNTIPVKDARECVVCAKTQGATAN